MVQVSGSLTPMCSSWPWSWLRGPVEGSSSALVLVSRSQYYIHTHIYLPASQIYNHFKRSVYFGAKRLCRQDIWKKLMENLYILKNLHTSVNIILHKIDLLVRFIFPVFRWGLSPTGAGSLSSHLYVNMLTSGNLWPWWEYPHLSNWQKLQSRELILNSFVPAHHIFEAF